MITSDETGTLLVVEEQHHAVVGRHFKRVVPIGDAGDFVRVVGKTQRRADDGIQEAVLVVCPTQFGAVPEGWASFTQEYPIPDFAEEYAITEPPSATDALLEQLAAADATKARDAERLEAEARRLADLNARVAQITKEQGR